MQVQPYLFVNGRCEEAADFYRRTIGAEEIMLMRWKDCPEPQQPGMVPPGSEDTVMHMALRIGDTTVLASDGPCQGQQSFQGFALSLTVPNEADADRKFVRPIADILRKSVMCSRPKVIIIILCGASRIISNVRNIS
jgi:PhnB protein